MPQVLRATHAHDLERLAEAGARLEDELAAKAARDAKAEEEAEEAAAEKALRERQLAAVITIQAAWRGCKVCAALIRVRCRLPGEPVVGCLEVCLGGAWGQEHHGAAWPNAPWGNRG